MVCLADLPHEALQKVFLHINQHQTLALAALHSKFYFVAIPKLYQNIYVYEEWTLKKEEQEKEEDHETGEDVDEEKMEEEKKEEEKTEEDSISFKFHKISILQNKPIYHSFKKRFGEILRPDE